ncbi:TPA: hypothetical protein ACH9JS_002796, partial [Escherichia coli]
MLKIIPGATGYFNKTLNSNQFENKDATKDKLDDVDATEDKLDKRGSIKGKLNNIYGKKVTSRRNNSATCPDFFSNQMKEKDFFLFVVFVFSG